MDEYQTRVGNGIPPNAQKKEPLTFKRVGFEDLKIGNKYLISILNGGVELWDYDFLDSFNRLHQVLTDEFDEIIGYRRLNDSDLILAIYEIQRNDK